MDSYGNVQNGMIYYKMNIEVARKESRVELQFKASVFTLNGKNNH